LDRLLEKGIADKADPAIHGGEAVGETMEARAGRLIGEFLAKRKMGLEELRARPKGDKLKTELATELRKRTTMTVAWIAEKLNAGAPQTLWGALGRYRGKSDNTRD